MWLTLAGLAGTALFNGLAARRSNKVNQRNYEEVRRYNTPRAQMGRFREAGLNPNLIYTQTNEAEQRPDWVTPQFDFSSLGQSASSELASYQNIKESKSRVDNLVKQNDLLDQQIISQSLVNMYQDLVNSNYQDLTDLQKANIKATTDHLYKAIEQIDKQIELVTKQIEDYSKQWSFRTRDLQLQNARLLFDRLANDRQFTLELKKFGLSREQFEEAKRQFTVNNQFQEYMMSFLQGLSGNDDPREAAKAFGAMVKAWILGTQSNFSQFDHSEQQRNSARQQGIPYRQGGHWHRPWDSDY